MTARRLASSAGPDRDWDSLQFKVIFALSFSVFLPIAVVRHVVPALRRDEATHRSILADACAYAGTTAQLAFAG